MMSQQNCLRKFFIDLGKALQIRKIVGSALPTQQGILHLLPNGNYATAFNFL